VAEGGGGVVTGAGEVVAAPQPAKTTAKRGNKPDRFK
jgi:hypothetical protein